jgi:GlcNAc-P-P-Und epimerase
VNDVVNAECIGVIGGSGFVGREVLRQLAEVNRIAVNIDRDAPSNPGLAEWRKADLSDTTQLQFALKGCTHIILLAAEWRDDIRPVARYYDVNFGGTANVIAAAKSLGISQLVFTSSVSIYGHTTFEVEEDYPPQPINDYGKSKLLAERELLHWASDTDNLALTIVRPTVIFGPGNRGNVWNLLRQMSHGPFVMIGNGQNRKSVAYVENVSAFLIQCLTAKVGTHVFNYADKPDLSMTELTQLVGEQMNRKAGSGSVRIPRSIAMPSAKLFDLASALLRRPFGITSERVMKFCANTQYSAAAVAATGFIPPVTIRDALAHTISTEFAPGAK